MNLDDLFNELEKEAYITEFHGYEFKTANQIIRKRFEQYAEQKCKEQRKVCSRNAKTMIYANGVVGVNISSILKSSLATEVK